MALAALIGTTVGFTDYYNCVYLEKDDGSAIVVTKNVFDYLYSKLDNFTAAFKRDCIDYAVNDPMICLCEQPAWYGDLIVDDIIRYDCSMGYYYPESGEEISISPGSVILRNFQGDYMYMDYNVFIKYYDFPGSEFIE